ncbi:MAG: OmpA family protein [Desulfobacterales bacterium]|nr:OmpA family protein [Desulfobacterales bacterium]
MYLEYYGLKRKPFNISPDPRFLWLGERHREALATLRYGIQENKGFLLLTGDVGTGKTVLINSLIKLVDVKVIVAAIPDPGLGLIDFYNILADEFKMGRGFTQKGEFLIHFKKFLITAYGAKKTVLLIIDEAQRLEHELLDEVRVLSNIDFRGSKLINIFLVGQSELREMLLEERNRPFRQRIAVNYNIEPLNEKETVAFIEHRLKFAGATRKNFIADAMREIHAFSNGFPRLINVMCDHALMSGYSAGLTMIDGGIIKGCAKELQITVDRVAPSVKEEISGAYRPPTLQPPIDEDIEKPEIQEKGSFVRIVGFIAIFITFIAVILSFLSPSQLEQSSKLARHDNETAIEPISIDNEKKQTATIADSEGGTTDIPVNIQDSQEIKVVNNTEKVVVDSKQLDKDLKEIKADTISQDEPPNDQLSKKELTEGKYSTRDEKESAGLQAANQSAQNQGEQLPLLLSVHKILIYFDQDSTEIDSQHLETLAEIAFYLSRNSDTSIIVEGYTDSYGSNFYNQNLSQLRANTVKSYLVGRGIANSQIKAIGLGSKNPIGDNENQEGRSKNRRVEIKFEKATKNDAVN